MIRATLRSSTNSIVILVMLVLSGHSGGGAFLFEYISAVDVIRAEVSGIIFLDANYSYDDSLRHGDTLLAWLKQRATRQLMVVAYDDREIELNGKKVVGPEGGTWRASERMLTRFRLDGELVEEQANGFRHVSGHHRQIQFFIHPNTDNKILHTALVGQMNGVLHSLTFGTALQEAWGKFGGEPAYEEWIQPQPFLDLNCGQVAIPADIAEVKLVCPDRSADALTGSQFAEQMASAARQEREVAIVRELLSGNLPERLRTLVPIQVRASDTEGKSHTVTFFVTSDYLAIGSNSDALRLPMSPQSAVTIADAVDATLLTVLMSDQVFCAATARLPPQPLTENRESFATFLQHHRIIESQLADWPDRRLVAGTRKDVVMSNRLLEQAHRVAIYGWHSPDGKPVQPLYTGHVDWYVDYSHGVRLVARSAILDGSAVQVGDILRHPQLHALLSNEGPIDQGQLRRKSKW